jgi:hypothetical protein
MKIRPLGILALLLISGRLAWSEPLRHWFIQSKADRYELIGTSKHAEVNGKPADMGVLQSFIPLLTDALGDDCPKISGAPDVTVKEDGAIRQIYIAQGVVKSGAHCLAVEGDGLQYFPIHRDFLIGGKEDSIPLNSPVKILRKGEKIAELIPRGSAWKSENKKFLLNWDFIERFTNSLRSFTVRFRVGLEAGKEKPNITVQTDGQSYEFYKLSDTLWAVKKPRTRWLEASDDWSFWYDFDNPIIEDRLAAQIHAIEQPGQDPAKRVELMVKMGSFWSPNVRDFYHRILLNKSEPPDMQRLALQRLKGKPAEETMEVMVQFLPQTQDDDLRRLASQILKISHPEGPLYNPNASSDERANTLQYWSRWWAKTHKQP